MRKISLYWEANILASGMEIWYVLGHFSRHSMLLGVKNYTNTVTDKRQNKLLNTRASHYFTAQTGIFFLQEEVGGLNGIKILQNHAKKRYWHLKAAFIPCSSVDHVSDTKNDIPIQLGQVFKGHKIHIINILQFSFCCFTWQLGSRAGRGRRGLKCF